MSTVRAKYKDRFITLAVDPAVTDADNFDSFCRRFAAHAFELSQKRLDLNGINTRLNSIYQEAYNDLIKIVSMTLDVHKTIPPNEIEIIEKEG